MLYILAPPFPNLGKKVKKIGSWGVLVNEQSQGVARAYCCSARPFFAWIPLWAPLVSFLLTTSEGVSIPLP